MEHITVIWCDWGDHDTATLQKIWQDATNIDVIHITQWNDVMETCVNLALEREDDTLLLCGHGTKYGLLAPNSISEYVIHDFNSSKIHARNVIGLFCHASSFAERNDLHGLFSSMFISNIEEALDYCVKVEDDTEIYSANNMIFKELSAILCNGVSLEECHSNIVKLRNTAEYHVMEFNAGGMKLL